MIPLRPRSPSSRLFWPRFFSACFFSLRRARRRSPVRPRLPARPLAALLAALVLALLGTAACSGPVQVRPVEVGPSPAAVSSEVLGNSAPEAGAGSLLESLSPGVRQTLRLAHLEDELEVDPRPVFRILDVLRVQTGERRYGAAAAEVALAAAGAALEGRAPVAAGTSDYRQAGGWYLLAASRAFDYLVAEPRTLADRAFDPELPAMISLYRRAVGDYLSLWPSLEGSWRDHRRQTSQELFEVEVERGPTLWDSGLWNPEDFDRLVPVDGLEVEGLRNRYQRPGLGAPVVAVRQNRRHLPLERFYPPEGIVRPATAVLVFDPRGELAPESGSGVARRGVALRLYDPAAVERVETAAASVPLAADFSTPWAYLAARAELTAGLIKAEKAWEHLGLFLVEPYDAEKVPVIMVHGLRSTPLAWLELTNDLLGDPELRDRYQIWHFTYPTSLPYLYTASLLRDALEDLQATADPRDYHPAMDSMVVVAHSMGGLVAKSLVTGSGRRLWDEMMRVEPERLAGSPADLERLRRVLILEPHPAIQRVVFIATPHGGSAMAASFLGRLASTLVRLPREFTAFFQRLTEANPGAVQPELEKVLTRGGPKSIRSLAPDHGLLQTLAALPVADGVTYHTIVGDKGTPEEPRWTDGVVPYASSSIPGAASERVIYGAGHDVYADPLAIAEVKRILRQHLRELDGD